MCCRRAGYNARLQLADARGFVLSVHSSTKVFIERKDMDPAALEMVVNPKVRTVHTSIIFIP